MSGGGGGLGARVAAGGALLTALLAWGCASGVGGVREVAFAPSLAVDLAAMTETSSGLFYRDASVGSGPAAGEGDRVTIHFLAYLPDGTLVDTSVAAGEPVTFRLGGGEVIAGWEEGVAGMRPGGRRQLVVPPRLAYGRRGAGDRIPPDAVLVFEVQLLSVD